MNIRIVPMAAEHVPGAVALQRECFPPPFPEALLWRPEHLHRHLELFPAGQFAALYEGRVVGSASMARIAEMRWRAHESWEATVGGPFMNAFDPEGTTLYGMDISVAPHVRGHGIGRRLYEARFETVRVLGCMRFGTACRIPDFATWQGALEGGHRQYIDAVIQTRAIDRTLTPLLRYGLSVVDILEDYMEDEESGNAAVLLEWTP